MAEPNKAFFLESAREFWYRKDRYFDHLTESPLDYDDLVMRYANYFRPLNVAFFGGPAYFLILNSLIMRVPLFIKNILAFFLFPIEQLWNRIPGRALFPAFLAQWQKRDTE